MIPQDKIAAVTRGLNVAFGVAAFDDIRDMTERPGSNRVFRIVVGGSAYLLRINTRAGDMTRHFNCMRAAAEADLAPRVHYTSAEDGISITDFVEAVPLQATEALRRVPAVLRTLHALPPFPESPFNTTCTFLLHKGAALDGFLQKFLTGNSLPQQDLDELVAQYTRLAAVFSSLDPNLAPSHNDLFKPDNILFDGSRVWLVDCNEGDLFLHTECKLHGDVGLEVGCDHERHLLMIGCRQCQVVLREFALNPSGYHFDGGCVWGYEDWDRLSEGHKHTWFPLHQPCEIAYDRAAGEVYVCEGQQMRFRFSIVMRPSVV